MLVRDLATSQVITLPLSVPVTEAATLMRDQNIGAIVIVDDERRPIGILTDRDIVLSVVAVNKHPGEFVVEDIMTRELVMVDEETDIFQLLKKISEKSIRRIPVTKKGELVGIVSVDDIIVVIATELSNLAVALSSTSKVL
ncbi:CBS domain-containing protein [Desulfobacterota bacterium AH_259_B03_O07]|nr:CBS domain-containing protein [Desulfobacterota bacterium AH_259_B03_O07]